METEQAIDSVERESASPESEESPWTESLKVPTPSFIRRANSDLGLFELGNRLVPDMNERCGSSSALAEETWYSPRSQDSGMREILAWHLIQISAPAFRPKTPSVRDEQHSKQQQSSEEVEDHSLRVFIDTSFLDGAAQGDRKQSLVPVSEDVSSSSVLAPQSAPSSPQADQLGPSSTNTPAVSIPPPRSPNHGFNNHERQTLKPLIVSAPVMTQAQSGGSLRTPQPTTADPLLTPGSDQGGPTSNKSRQKKFHRHFKQVEAEEHVLNYYSCALVGDILLQGHLYITKNYFAFYSNVFGYVTKLLIPTASVTKISKEKTARIIPNAIGVATEDEKHVFGSLLSRDSTYKFMIEVWKSACSSHPPDIMVPKPKILKKVVDAVTHSETNILDDDDDDDSSLSGSDHSGPPSQAESRTDISHSETCQSKVSISSLRKRTSHHFSAPKKPETLKESISHTNGLLLVSTILLVALFLSAAFLLYRISRIHDRFADNPLLTGSDDVYEEILKWQSQLHTRSASEVQEFLNTNLNQIVRVRQSLEALSSLIPSQEENSTPSGEQKTFIPNNNS